MKSLKKATLLFGMLFIITRILYPLGDTSLKVLFPAQAHGNLIVGNNNKIIGSKLIGQNFLHLSTSKAGLRLVEVDTIQILPAGLT